MAKRRNMKKEKVERNKIYARKFNKSRAGGRFSRKGNNNAGRSYGGGGNDNNNNTGKAEE